MTLTRSRRLVNLAIAIDSAAGTSLLKKVTDSGEYVVPAFTDVGGAPSVLDSSLTTSIIDSSYIQLRQTGGVGSVLDSAELVAFADSNYITSRFTTGNSGFKLFRYDATANQTTFENADKGGTSLSYNPQGIIVFYNGVALLDSAEYTATNGTSVVLDSGAALNAKIQIASWNIPSSGGGGSSFGWGGARGVTAGGDTTMSSANTNVIDYFDMTTTGNATDFGDLSRSRMHVRGVSNSTRVVWSNGGQGSLANIDNTIDYITTATTGNATDFGNRSVTYGHGAVTSDGTYGLFAGGEGTSGGGAPYSTNVIDYITIANTGNATDFGDMTASKEIMGSGVISNGTIGYFFQGNSFANYVTIATPGNATNTSLSTNASSHMGCVSDTTRGLLQGGATIEYFAIGTSISASDFGDLSNRQYAGATSNGTVASFCGGYMFDGSSNIYNYIENVTIQTPGNATDHGDLTQSVAGRGASSGSAS